MLGRTDSRRRLLVLLVVFVVGSLALTARLAYWQVVDRERLASEAMAQTTVNLETPSKRGDIFDRTGTVVLATTVPRERLVAAPDQLTPDQRRKTVAELTRILGLDDADSIAMRDALTSDSKYLILRHGLDRSVADQIRAALVDQRVFGLTLEPEPERVYPQVGGGPGSTLAAHLLGFVNRDGTGQYGVEQAYQSTLAGEPRVLVTQRDASGQPIIDEATVSQPGVARPGPAPDDRRRPPAAGRAGAARGLGRRPGQAGLGGRHGSVHRRDLRDGDLPVVRRQRLQGDRGERPGTLHRPDRVDGLRAGLRVQDDDRGGRPGGRAPSRRRPGSRTSGRSASTTARPRSTTPTARGWAGCRSRTASPIRATWWPPRSPSGSARRPANRRRILHDMWLRLGYGTADRDRRRRRGRRPGPRPGRDPVARDRPRQRRLRAGRRGHADPAGDGLRGADERRDDGPAARRQVGRRSRRAGRADDQGHRCGPVGRRSSR